MWSKTRHVLLRSTLCAISSYNPYWKPSLGDCSPRASSQASLSLGFRLNCYAFFLRLKGNGCRRYCSLPSQDSWPAGVPSDTFQTSPVPDRDVTPNLLVSNSPSEPGKTCFCCHAACWTLPFGSSAAFEAQ